MKVVELFFILLASASAAQNINNFISNYFNSPLGDINPDAYGNFTQYAERYGFTTETHSVTTEDGFILVLFRISGIQGNQSNIGKPVVFFQHGLLNSADTWITNEPDITPGFQMVRAGFDCWFGNSRGTKYSRYHTYLSRSDKVFWDWSWMQMGEFDVPAVVDYVLAQTGKSKLTWIGHSQGTMQMFAHLSDVPDFADKINIFIALAPIASIAYQSSHLLEALGYTPIAQIMMLLRIYDFAQYIDIPTLVYEFCTMFDWICSSVLYLLGDLDISLDNLSRIPVFFAHEFGGTSVRNMMHYEQASHYSSSNFCKYSYGDLENMRVYHSTTAPCYEMGAIKAPIAWWKGTKDKFADDRDVAWLKSQLNPEILVQENYIENYGHMTMIWGKNMTYFDEVIAMTKQYSESFEETN